MCVSEEGMDSGEIDNCKHIWKGLQWGAGRMPRTELSFLTVHTSAVLKYCNKPF